MHLNEAAEKVRSDAGLNPDTLIQIIDTITQIFASCPKRNARFFQQEGQSKGLLARRIAVRAIQSNMNVGRGEAQRIAYHLLETCCRMKVEDIEGVMGELHESVEDDDFDGIVMGQPVEKALTEEEKNQVGEPRL